MSYTVTDSVRIGKAAMVLIYESGNLPVVGTGTIFQITSNWLVPDLRCFGSRISELRL